MKILIFKNQKEKIKELSVDKWPVWECPKKEFDWYYDDTESCFFIEGKVKIKTDFEEVQIGKGDFVVFPKGLKCVWSVFEPVKKYYAFTDISDKL